MSNPPPDFRFPFGLPVTPCQPSADGPRRLFILGAYPSALHVRWTPPAPLKPIAAIAVDNEPTPFWTGDDEKARVEAWLAQVGWRSEWGQLSPVGRLNGSSGRWVAEKVLAPLGATHSDAWITDALDTYRCSVDLAARLDDTYKPFAADMHLPMHQLGSHPSENAIVRESLEQHRERLQQELAAARPEILVTLGNAALRVAAELVEVVGAARPSKLAVEGYGTVLRARFDGREFDWLPLAHPAAPKAYQGAHAGWIKRTANRSEQFARRALVQAEPLSWRSP